MKPFILDIEKILPVNEVYSCLQGEGKYSGVPSVMIRFSGCPLRCMFSETDFCDSFFSSWSPEKGKYSLTTIFEEIEKYPKIKHIILSGGSPTMHEVLLPLISLIKLKFKEHHITIETEGSRGVVTQADFISLSPKLTSSRPIVGTTRPWDGKKVTENDLRQHEKERTNYEAMKTLISHHLDYQLKIVISSERDIEEVRQIQKELSTPDNKVYLMPAGATQQELDKHRKLVMELALSTGYNYTDRLHIICYNNKRLV